jgi:hypothetical protein
VSCFNHIKIVPKPAMSIWVQCYIKASNGLSDALELVPTQDAASRLIIRRAFMWYILLPQLIIRNPGKTSTKNTEIIIMRCVDFLGGNYGALLNKWETDRKKALLRPTRKRKPEDEKARLKRATDDILNAKPDCISCGAVRILGIGLGSCDTTTINDQMLAKHPHPMSDETWTPYKRSADHSDDIVFTNLPEHMDRLDPYVGVGSRGVHAHYITCLNRARMNGLDAEECAGVQQFRKRGELVLGNVCPWVSR